MYERSAIVLERYMEKILEFNKNYNLKKNYENFNELITEIENYQIMTDKETKVIQEFDNTARKIQNLQQEQERLYKINRRLEDDRVQLFNDLGEDAKLLDSKFKKIENTLEKNNEQLKEIREEFIHFLSDFSQKQKERNKCEKTKRVGEANHIEYIERVNTEFSEIDGRDLVNIKDFVSSEKEQIKKEALEIMIKNGKSERVAFDQDVLRKAINTRMDIAEKEAECYAIIYERMKKLLSEIETDTVKLNKHKKTLRDTSVKLAFLKAEKEYIVGFLDYERMTAISGTRAHKKMMREACQNFELDMIQIKNLYELILKEVSGKSTKKAYKELYNKTYLRNIEDKEKNFEEEVNHVNISMGTVINSNYWRIEGIKNIYNVFQAEVSEKFEKDLSAYRIEDLEEVEAKEMNEYEKEEYSMEPFENIDDEEEDEENETEQYTNEDKQIQWDEEEEQQEEIKKNEENIFDDEDSIEEIIEKSRKKTIRGKHHKEKENKGLFNQLFKKS